MRIDSENSNHKTEKGNIEIMDQLENMAKKRSAMSSDEESTKNKRKKHIKSENSEDTDDSDVSMIEEDTKENIFSSLRRKINDEEPVDDVTDECFMLLLSNAKMEMSWRIPTLHTLSRNLDRPLSETCKQRIAELKLPYRAGPFTPGEDKILEKNWTKMCHKFNLPNCPEVFGRWRNFSNNREFLLARRKALLYLGRNLEHRTLGQIYSRFKSYKGCTKKGRFTEDEKEVIELFINIKKDNKEKGLTQSFLASILGRDKHSIWRYMKLRSKEEKQIIKWDMKSTEKFLKILLKEVNGGDDNSLNVRKLHKVHIPKSVWIKVAKEMDSHPMQMKEYWVSKVYTQIFATKPIYLTGLRIKLINILLERKYVYWQDVKWNEVAEEFDNCTPLFLWWRYYLLTKHHCPNLLKSIQDSAKYLHKKFIVEKNPMTNRRLKRLKFNKKGELEFKD